MSDVAQASIGKPNAETILASLRKQFHAWEPIEGQARKKLWQMLGDLYEAVAFFENDPTWVELQKLRDAARQAPGVSECKRFAPMNESVIDLLLVTLLGIRKETSATKSQWRAALIAAKLARCEHVSASFQTWLAKAGGIVAAKEFDLKQSISPSAAADEETKDLLTLEKFNFQKFAEGVAADLPEDRVKVVLDRETETFGGLSLALLFAPEDAKPGGAYLVEKIGDPELMRHVCAKVAQGRIKQLTPEEKSQRLLEHNLWTLNQVTLALAGRLDLKFNFAVWNAFRKAVKSITTHDQHSQKYFQGFHGVAYDFTEKGEQFTMEVKNPDFLEIDPGRYLGGARKGALIPYDVSKFGTPKGDEAIKDYVLRHAEPWRYRQSR